MPLPTLFGGLTAATGQQLDDNFSVVSLLGTLPCTVAGVSSIDLTMAATNPTITAYANYMAFSGIAAGTNPTVAIARVGALPQVQIYKTSSSGSVPLTGGEIVAGALLILVYDSALGGGSGGFHLASLSPSTLPITNLVTVNNNAGVTLTAAQITGSGAGSCVLSRTGAPGGGFNDTTDTATAILGALLGATVGTTFRIRMSNATGQTQTLLAGMGVTVVGTATTATGTTHVFEGVITATGTPAITVYG